MLVIREIILEPNPIEAKAILTVKVEYENDREGVVIQVSGSGRGLSWGPRQRPALVGKQSATFTDDVSATGELPGRLEVRVRLRASGGILQERSREIKVVQ